ncbi:MAG: class D sortase, partial [Candidatus Dormibacteraeota bacterium]|nr:class D sortase [Candidatus Dormibacteraeota bacterium]
LPDGAPSADPARYASNTMPRSSLIRLVSWLLMGGAISLAVYAGSNAAYDATTQTELSGAWDRTHHASTPPTATSNGAGALGGAFQVQRPRLAVGQPLAKMRVPAVDWSGVVLEGSDDRVLSGGPGHLVGTAYPGEPDNVVVSNHNTYSMQFAKLKTGDQIILDSDYGSFTYRVTGFRVVSAGDRSVTAHTARASLTFTTCYPLWAGAFASQRYVIGADLVSR